MTGKNSEWVFGRLSVTWFLVLINLLFFSITKIFFNENYLDYFALKPAFIIHGIYLWSILTSFFIHVDISHLLINLFLLISFGSVCEKIIGRKRFLFFYLVSGLIIGVIFVFLSGFIGLGEINSGVFGSPNSFSLGASGVIFAIAGVIIVLTPKFEFNLFILPFSIRAYIIIPLLLVLMWAVSFWLNLPVGNFAHFSGFIIGFVYGFFLKTKYPNKFIF